MEGLTIQSVRIRTMHSYDVSIVKEVTELSMPRNVWNTYAFQNFSESYKKKIEYQVEFYKNVINSEELIPPHVAIRTLYEGLGTGKEAAYEDKEVKKYQEYLEKNYRRLIYIQKSFKRITSKQTPSTSFEIKTTNLKKLCFQILIKEKDKSLKKEIKQRINYFVNAESNKKRKIVYEEIMFELEKIIKDEEKENGCEWQCTDFICNLMYQSIYHPLNGKYKDIINYYQNIIQIYSPVYEWISTSKFFNHNIDETICTVIDIKTTKKNEKYYNINFQGNNVWLSEILINKI